MTNAAQPSKEEVQEVWDIVAKAGCSFGYTKEMCLKYGFNVKEAVDKVFDEVCTNIDECSEEEIKSLQKHLQAQEKVTEGVEHVWLPEYSPPKDGETSIKMWHLVGSKSKDGIILDDTCPPWFVLETQVRKDGVPHYFPKNKLADVQSFRDLLEKDGASLDFFDQWAQEWSEAFKDKEDKFRKAHLFFTTNSKCEVTGFAKVKDANVFDFLITYNTDDMQPKRDEWVGKVKKSFQVALEQNDCAEFCSKYWGISGTLADILKLSDMFEAMKHKPRVLNLVQLIFLGVHPEDRLVQVTTLCNELDELCEEQSTKHTLELESKRRKVDELTTTIYAGNPGDRAPLSWRRRIIKEGNQEWTIATPNMEQELVEEAKGAIMEWLMLSWANKDNLLADLLADVANKRRSAEADRKVLLSQYELLLKSKHFSF